ncbi:hypothetical protein TNCV_1902961 [Trichonephila clavipes]|nr:hypothetical protein TNCV_1902961 [Trichonephila clavipes]
MLEKVIENWTSRLDYIRASRGSPMPEIIFKMLISVAVNSKQNNSHIVTPHMDIIYRQTSGLGIASQDIGDIWEQNAYLKMEKQ